MRPLSVGNSGLQALAWIQHARTHCLKSFLTLSSILYSPPRFSGDRPPDSQKPPGEISHRKKHGRETAKKHLQTLCLRGKRVSPKPVKSPYFRAMTAPPCQPSHTEVTFQKQGQRQSCQSRGLPNSSGPWEQFFLHKQAREAASWTRS